ncbi:hypothetical protein PsYK624_156480 [Phanerochaete sordida]|uniref:F-box domain-containing protein n=1 Tax=Phanerochaete sordida TaxID=48140 RepID=A0A9P3GTG8_9APHY|nr:hypothetical protein PsYK624_156480 [Phanerochaete sordida]
MPQSSVLSSTERLVLEARHDDLCRTVLALRKAMNDGNIVVTLPEDILLLIFKLYAAAPCRPGRHGWLAISWICARWRTIILHSATLWTNIPLTHLAAVECYLLRSRAAPLHVSGSFIHLPGTGPAYELAQRQLISTWSAVTEHSIRIQELAVTLDFGLPGNHLLESGLQHATFPQLRRLYISGENTYHLDRIDSDKKLPAFLRAVAEKRHLEEVTTTNIPLPLVVNMLSSSLKRLHIGVGSRTPLEGRLPSDLFWSGLRLLSSLQELSIAQFPSFPDPVDAGPLRASLPLPALKNLAVHLAGPRANCNSATYFLNHITLSADCSLRIININTTAHMLNPCQEALYMAISRVLDPHEHTAPLRMLHVARSEQYEQRFSFWTQCPTPSILSLDHSAMLRAGLHPRLEIIVGSTDTPRIGDLLRLLPLYAVEGIVFSDGSITRWTSIVPAPSVRVVAVSESAPMSAICKLVTILVDFKFMPALEELRFVGVPMARGLEAAMGVLGCGLQRCGRRFADRTPLRLVVDDPELYSEMCKLAEGDPLVESVEFVESCVYGFV